MFFFFFSSRRRHTRFDCDWSSDVCSSDLVGKNVPLPSGSTDQKAPPKSDQQQPPQVPSLSIDVDLMSFDVVVTDQGGNPISGLEKKHFRVFDDDVEQNVTNFSPADAPLTVVVLAEFSDTFGRSEEHTSELQSQSNLVCRLLLEKKKKTKYICPISSV